MTLADAGVDVPNYIGGDGNGTDVNAQSFTVHTARIADAIRAINFVADGNRMDHRPIGRIIAELGFAEQFPHFVVADRAAPDRGLQIQFAVCRGAATYIDAPITAF
jgi:hypothetical protein